MELTTLGPKNMVDILKLATQLNPNIPKEELAVRQAEMSNLKITIALDLLKKTIWLE